MRKGSKQSAESNRKNAEAHIGNCNRLTHGNRSLRIKEQKPVNCDQCELGENGCPGFVKGAVCSMRTEIISLAEQAVQLTGDDRFYDHHNLCYLLSTVISANGARLARGMHQEVQEDLGIDESVTRLSTVVTDQIKVLARLLGYDQPDVLIDRRTQTVNVNVVESLSPEQHQKALEALADLREATGSAFDQLIDEV